MATAEHADMGVSFVILDQCRVLLLILATLQPINYVLARVGNSSLRWLISHNF